MRVTPPCNMAAAGDNENNDNELLLVDDFACLDVFESDSDSTSKRPTCQRCKRPLTVCLCPFLPREPLEIKTTIYILQHPFEESRCLRTVPILQNSVPADRCQIFRGKRFSKSRFPDLVPILESANTVLLYPGDDAVDISELPTGQTYNLVLLDGTWAQAKGIYTQNEYVRKMRKVKIRAEQKSKYVIRTQPSDTSLSTLETAAIAVATLERKPEIAETLLQPLVALCDFQLQHGATTHQSREYQMEHGLWTKPMSRADHRKLAKKCAGEQGSPGT